MRQKTLTKRAKQVLHQYVPGSHWRDISIEWKRVFWEYVLYEKRHKIMPYAMTVKLSGPAFYFSGSFDGTISSVPLQDGEILQVKSYDRILTSDELARNFQEMLKA